MKRLLMFTTILIALIPAMSFAQMSETAEVKQITGKYDMGVTKTPSVSFLDLSRLNISHSYSIGYFSGGGVSGSQAMYNGTIRYQLANPLMLTLNFGILHDPSALWGGQSQLGTQTKIYPSGQLDWKPSENFRMQLGFYSSPGTYISPFSLGGYDYWRP
ncbi:MAG: hypothetical protein R3F48_05045 [Candidatus Zixiibacteriota bacterium]